MADYYPLIERAVAGLTKNTGENRRTLYDRARGALVNQLRSVDPPLDESDITRERLALEEAIRKVEAEASKRRPEAPEAGAPPSISDAGLRGFRDTVADAEALGEATAGANPAARELHGSMPGEPPLPEKQFEPTPAEPPPPSAVERRVPPAAAEPPPPPVPQEENDFYSRPVRSYRGIITIVLLLLVLGGRAAGAYWQRDRIMTMASLRSSTPASKPREAAEPMRPKIADRIGPAEGAPAAANAPAVAVAQKVVLYDEDPSDPQGKRYVGSALWRTETVSPGPGLAPELAIRADVEIPERHMRMTWSLRRNTDKALPASHTIEIMFTLPADFPEGGIGNVPGVLMKQDEQARGVPLAGLAVKVTNGYFLIGLSAVDVDVQRNVRLLKERDWFDIPIVYTSNKRAILALEKGTPGARAFEEAFRAWGQ